MLEYYWNHKLLFAKRLHTHSWNTKVMCMKGFSWKRLSCILGPLFSLPSWQFFEEVFGAQVAFICFSNGSELYPSVGVIKSCGKHLELRSMWHIMVKQRIILMSFKRKQLVLEYLWNIQVFYIYFVHKTDPVILFFDLFLLLTMVNHGIATKKILEE